MAPITILAVLAGCSLVGSFSLIGCPHTLAVRATQGRRLRPTPLRALVMRQLYPVGAPLTTGNLAVSSVHTLYYELHGKADGVPALFLHGGPGAGCARRHAGFFDPTHYRVVLFDQRGCGKSTPRGSLEGNDTPSLVADCEALRRHLGIETWDLVLGGSWGVTLALAYAARHPTKVSALVLRAVCLMRTKEVLWLFGDRGIGRLIPDGFHAYSSACDTERTQQQQQQQQQQQPSPPNDDGDEGRFLRWYASALREELGKEAM